ncbi:MAG: hypothetical protein PVF58_03780 [Candidatus Methanofastidiosia archaeon]|jgi:hypothetical protein
MCKRTGGIIFIIIFVTSIVFYCTFPAFRRFIDEKTALVTLLGVLIAIFSFWYFLPRETKNLEKKIKVDGQLNKINWSIIKTGQQFQRFCNKLLEFEFGSNFIPYGIKGRDMGIDAQFIGEYCNKNGNFIFNYKFLDPSTDKNKARGLIFQQLKGAKGRKAELQKMDDANPDFYYILTNVKITPHWRKKIKEISKGYDFEVTIWDGEKLESLITKHPLIYQLYFGAEPSLFFKYQDYFSRELGGESPLDHSIPLYGREDETKCFEEFLMNEKKILMISGQGGIGKTRLLIEFAKVAEQEGWTQRFIRIETETFDDHLRELSPDEKYVLFLDDAHKYSNFDKLLSFLRSEKPEKIKFIFSTLPIFSSDLKNKISIFQFPSDYKEMKIQVLENEEIIQILNELEIPPTEQRIICGMSNGLPLIAILTAQLIKEGVPYRNIPSHEIMQSLFERHLNELERSRNYKHVNLLKILAFLVPFSLGNETIHEKIRDFMNISEFEEYSIIQNLMKEKFIEAKADKIKIVSDLMGEHLIMQTCFTDGKPTGFHEKIIKEFVQLAPKQVITNLAVVESREDNKILLDGFLGKIKQDALQENSATKSAILYILEDLSYLRPDDTLDILKNLSRSEKGAFEYTDKYWEKAKITKILRRVANYPDTFEEAVEILKDLAMEEGGKRVRGESAEKVLIDVCGIQYYRDIRIFKGNLQYRNDFRKKILAKLKSWLFQDEFLDHLILKTIEKQLTEKVEWMEKSLEKVGKINLYTIKLPEGKRIREMRGEFFDILFKIGSDSPWTSVRAEASVLFGDIWREMKRSENQEKKGEKPILEEKKKRREEEKEKILQILLKRAKEEANWNVIDRILEVFRYLRDWEEEEIQHTIVHVLNQFEQDNEFQLYRILAGTLSIEENEEIETFMEERAKYFSEIFTAEELIQLLNKILEEDKCKYLRETFFYELGVQSPDYALQVFQLLQETDSKARMYSGYILGGLRVSDAQNTMSIITDLRTKNDMRTIIKSYEVLISYRDFDKEDLDLLEEFLEKSNEDIQIKVCRILSKLRYVNPKRYLEILEKASHQATPELARIILRKISRYQSEYNKDEIDICKSIIMNFLSLDNIFSFEFSFIMNGIVKYDPLFFAEFLEERIGIGKKPDSFPIEEAVENLVKNEDYLEEVLRKIRDWMDRGDPYAMKAPSIFWKICSVHGGEIRLESEPIVNEVLQEWVEEGDHEKMRNVARLLLHFPLTEWILKLFEEIIIKSSGDQNILSLISAAIGTGGQAEMAAFGETSPQERNKIELLEKTLKKSTNRHLRKFAENEIRRIKEFSKWMTERMEEEW